MASIAQSFTKGPTRKVSMKSVDKEDKSKKKR